MTDRIETTCCIAGGGPAGVMLGNLLARAGVAVLVLEKHADFLRDFRGDTIHPSTLGVMAELGLLEELLRLPHQPAHELAAVIDGARFAIADFSALPVRCPFIAFMPQWDFLDFLARDAARHPGFHLRMQAEVTGLLTEAGRVVGVQARTPAGPLEVRADLVVGVDGRGSIVRQAARLPVRRLGAPMDVLWFRLPREASDPQESMGVFGAGEILVLIDRGGHWQCGYVIPKGGFEALRARGLPDFHARLARLAPFLAARAAAVTAWEAVKLLTVAVDRLRAWSRPGLLCIGDAAHAMSPIGGVGINLAIQDAVAAANLLAAPLRERRLRVSDLRRVQRRRAWPTWATQRLQVLAQGRIIARVLGGRQAPRPPLPVRLLARLPWLRRVPARLIGLGLRPEHVDPGLRGTTPVV
ncbi:FAD-dependent oxidoreductase [Rhodovastum atsumiense]|uniref:FAD-dependent oxidoreductase n=1 Tax=Rhodovastum atsumiense TaxID=504468 RepID=A0A5M6IM34_9PROT|nr:FAD-dependent oxidoreductase [Rhodovastum atsumiense]KAA5609292.1 FAD-dependent oxidoreductase [Rhodovastum atsumiense]CAH2604591.1 FAD-dependent oxidoreductase [Rhodovastum atsumiense]